MASNASAGNFFQFRHEITEDHSQCSRFLLKNNSENWIVGGKIISGENGFMSFDPHVLKKIGYGIALGIKSAHNSNEQDYAGPDIRYNFAFRDFSSIIDYAFKFDLCKNNDLHDLWACISTKKIGSINLGRWKVGSEIWYFNYLEGTENVKLRPLKITYDWKMTRS